MFRALVFNSSGWDDSGAYSIHTLRSNKRKGLRLNNSATYHHLPSQSQHLQETENIIRMLLEDRAKTGRERQTDKKTAVERKRAKERENN